MQENATNDDAPDDSAPILMKYGQAAQMLQVSERTIWSLVNERRVLPAVRVGDAVRIDRRDLLAFIESRKQST